MTAFEESATNVENDSSHLTIERLISNPYSIDTPWELLKRTFLVASLTWNNVLTVQTISFPGAFLNVPTITNVFSRFAYFRAGIHVEVKLQSTPYHQGSLLVGWLPCGNNAPSTNQMISGYDATVLSASTQDSCSYDIPYLHPSDWLTTNIGASNNADICKLYISPLNVLVTSSASIAASVPVLVFASFKDIEVTGYVSQMKTGPRFPKNKEASSKQEDGLDAKSAVTTVSKLVRKLPIVGETYSAVADIVNTFAGDLSKPTSTVAPDVMLPLYYSDVNHASGLTQAVPISLYPNPYIKQAPQMFGMETSHMKVTDIARRPLLFDQATFNNVITSWSTVVQPQTVGGFITGGDYLRAMCRIARFWRGSIKYLIHFCVPAFYSFRVRFSVNYAGTPNNYGDLQTRVIDVKGETWETIVIPYLEYTTWRDLGAAGNPPTFKIELVTGIVGSSAPATPIVYVNIFRAAGEDFELAGLINASVSPIGEGEKYSNQMHIGRKFKESFTPLNKGTSQSLERGLVMPDVIGTVSDCIKRAQIVTSTISIPGQDSFGGALNYFGAFFVFWRGGRIMRHIHTTEGAPGTLAGWYLNIANAPLIDNGWVPAYASPASMYQQEAVHVPYMCGQPYYPYRSFASNYMANSCYRNGPIPTTLNLSSHTTVTLSAADDFVYLHLVPWGCALSFTEANKKTTAVHAVTSLAPKVLN